MATIFRAVETPRRGVSGGKKPDMGLATGLALPTPNRQTQPL